MIKLVCNGCRREINDLDKEGTQHLAQEWLRSRGAYDDNGGLINPNLGNYLATNGDADLFCPKCRSMALDYWNEKCEKINGWEAQYKASIKNHQKEFFSQKKKPQVIKPDAHKELPRLH
tara:strand:- start:876 stop:1232 length:357 start_codon:yes stop_codon:yes gene_type:complete